jgi:hypothetical protein
MEGRTRLGYDSKHENSVKKDRNFSYKMQGSWPLKMLHHFENLEFLKDIA